ncbi:MAG: amidohydrolase family protein [Thermoprotei archaeon]
MTLLIRNATTINPDGKFTRVNVFVEGNRIQHISADAIPMGSKRGEVIEGEGKILLPGLINAHVHTEETLWMNMIPDTVAHTAWFHDYTLPYYRALSADDAYWSTLLSHALMLLCGVTCCADSANLYPEADVEASSKSGLRAFIGTWASDLPGDFSKDTSKCLEEIENHLKRHSGEGRVRGVASVIGSNTCSDELYLEAARLAERYDVPITSHEASGHEDVLQCLKRTGERPVAHLARIGFLTRRTILSHVTDLADVEVNMLRVSGTGVVLCPTTELKKGKGLSRYGRIAQITRLGVRYCVATDNANSSNTLNPIRAASLLALLVKDFSLDPSAYTAREALRSITERPADILGIAAGRLEVGGLADLALFDAHNVYLQLGDPLQGCMYGEPPQAVDVVVDGELVVSGGKILRFNLEETLKQARSRAEAIVGRMGATG